MRKLSMFLCLVVCVGVLTSCGKETGGTESTTDTATTRPVNENIVIEIDKSSLADEVSVTDDLKAYGADIVDSDDGLKLVCEFTKNEYELLIQDKHEQTAKAFETLENDVESYVEKVEYDDDFRHLRIYVNKELYDTKAAASSFGNTFNDYAIAAKAVAYQLYLEDGQKASTEIYYSGTDELVSKFTLPAEKDSF